MNKKSQYNLTKEQWKEIGQKNGWTLYEGEIINPKEKEMWQYINKMYIARKKLLFTGNGWAPEGQLESQKSYDEKSDFEKDTIFKVVNYSERHGFGCYVFKREGEKQGFDIDASNFLYLLKSGSIQQI